MHRFLFVGGPLHGQAITLPNRPMAWRVPVARPLSVEYREPGTEYWDPGIIEATIEEVQYDRTPAECLGQQAEVYVIRGGRINELLERAIAQWLSTTSIRIFP